MKTLPKHRKLLFIAFAIITVFLSLTLLSIKKANAEDVITLKENFLSSHIESYQLTDAIDAYFGDDYVAIIKDSTTLVISKGYSDFTKVDYSFTALKQIKRLNDDYLIVSDYAHLKLVKLESGYPVEDMPGGLTANYFDISGNVLVGNYSGIGTKYILDGTSVSDQIVFGMNGTKPVTVFGDTVIFVNDSTLFKRTGGNLPEKITDKLFISPDNMITDGTFIYYILDNKVYKLSISGNQLPVLLNFNEELELGNPQSPVNICFKNENLMVISNDSIEEFAIDGDTLKFTGFAIAKNKTAYNRSLSSAKDIEKFGDTVAILDSDKLMLVDTSKVGGYDRDKFTNLFIDNAPDFFALGQTSLLSIKNDKIYINKFGAESDNITLLTQSVKDVCYFGGKYFILANDGINSYIYTVDESTSEIALFNTVYDKAYTNTCVKPDGELILSDDADIVKLATDLSGSVFALKTDGVLYSVNGTTFTPYSLSQDNITSFAVAFDKKEVYMINGSELVYSTDKLDNLSISKIEVPQTIKGLDSVIEPENLTSCKVKDGAFTVKINQNDEAFDFIEFVPNEDNYVVLEKNQSGNFAILLGDNKVVLTSLSNIKDEIAPQVNEENNESFISTGVHAYYLPVIDRDGTYVLKDANGNPISLDKNAKIKVLKSLSFLDTDYYYATVSAGDGEINCYIPSSFTTANVYKEAERKTETIDNSESAKDTTRNILIILACIACACGTFTYFILRRKTY